MNGERTLSYNNFFSLLAYTVYNLKKKIISDLSATSIKVYIKSFWLERLMMCVIKILPPSTLNDKIISDKNLL